MYFAAPYRGSCALLSCRSGFVAFASKKRASFKAINYV